MRAASQHQAITQQVIHSDSRKNCCVQKMQEFLEGKGYINSQFYMSILIILKIITRKRYNFNNILIVLICRVQNLLQFGNCLVSDQALIKMNHEYFNWFECFDLYSIKFQITPHLIANHLKIQNILFFYFNNVLAICQIKFLSI